MAPPAPLICLPNAIVLTLETPLAISKTGAAKPNNAWQTGRFSYQQRRLLPEVTTAAEVPTAAGRAVRPHATTATSFSFTRIQRLANDLPLLAEH